MERQATMHQYLLTSVDALMRNASGEADFTGTPVAVAVPSVNPGPVMTLEQQARALIAEHAQHAEQIRASLGGAM